MTQSILQFECNDGIEILIDTTTGESFASIRGYARMAGKAESTIRDRISKLSEGAREMGIFEAQIPTGKGFQGARLIREDLICEWLPQDNPSAAKSLLKLGVRVGLHKLAGYEVKTTAIVSQPVPTQIQALLAAVQQMAEMEQRQLEADRRLALAEAQLQEFAEVRATAHAELMALPPASHDIPPESTDMKIRRVVNNYCAATGLQQSEVYRNLYQAHYYRYRRRVETSGKESKLQAFIRLGLIDSLYDLAVELLAKAG